jgi:hypothetical protein
MNEALVAKAEEAMVGVLDTFIKAKDFAIEQAPDVIQQLLVWKTCYHVVYLVLGAAMLLSLIKMIPVCNKAWKDPKNTSDFVGVGSTLYVACIGFIGFLVFFYHLEKLLQITLAPKIWLIEYAASLVK